MGKTETSLPEKNRFNLDSAVSRILSCRKICAGNVTVIKHQELPKAGVFAVHMAKTLDDDCVRIDQATCSDSPGHNNPTA
ncbi:hypothetical protein EBAPG3_014555 [Nitrosospira lacus]|uniref:Uncharacterized protein n=1 Tax=Nitrosospira lacus TaxID=1288494 RepID=A0A1W6SSW0_9PROT|nr:hypothetical protein [Nitrosospira lacus]ARO88892.1 hypothetical protein EBAPG3_014555 [Nitrosospira lacus]